MSPSLVVRVALAAALCAGLFATVVRAQDGRDPEDFQLAIGLLERELHVDAAARFERFLEAHPRQRRAGEAWYRLGTCRLAMQQAEAAVSAFEAALRFRGLPLRAECRYRLADTQRALSRFEAARAQYRSLLDEVEADHYLAAAASYGESLCLRDLNRDDEALAGFLAVAKRGGEYAFSGTYQAGFVQLRSRRFVAAERSFAGLAERYPDHPAIAELRYLEGEAGFGGGEFARAEAAWRHSLRHDARGEYADDAVYGIGFCRVELDDPAAALTWFRRLVEDFDESPLVERAQLEAGRLLHRGGDHAAAVAELERLLGKPGLDAGLACEAAELRGLAELGRSAPEAAQASFERALAGASDAAVGRRLHYHLGDAQGGQGDWTAALKSYETAEFKAADELRGDALYAQVLALHKLGRFADSSRRAKRLGTELPGHRWVGLAEFAIAENAFELRQYEVACRRYDALPADHSKRAEADFKAAFAVYLGGDPAAAVARFEAVYEASGQPDARREQALSMVALCQSEAGAFDRALASADRYRAKYGERGQFLARTERIAAQSLRQRGELAAAADRMRLAAQAAKSGERAAALSIETADLAFQAGDFVAARKLYAKLADRSDRTGARSLEGLAWCAFELGDDADCERRIEAGLEHAEVGETAAGLLELATTLHHRGQRWAESAAAARRHLERFPKHVRRDELRYALGVALARGGELATAREQLGALAAAVLAKRAELARPDRVFYELAWVCRRAEDEPAALASFAQVVANSSDQDLTGEARLHLGEAELKAGQSAAARKWFAGIKGQYQARALYRHGFAWLAEQSMAVDERSRHAAESFERVVALGRRQALHDEASFMAGESRLHAGEHSAAATHLQHMLERAPEHERAQRARLYLGECQVRGDEAAAAIGWLTQFLQRGAEAPAVERARASLWLGRAHQTRAEHSAAIAALQAVTELSQGELAAEAQFRIGEVRSEQGDQAGAVDAFIKLAILYEHPEWVPRALLEAGQACEALERPAKAQKLFRELLSRFPKSPQAAVAKRHIRGI